MPYSEKLIKKDTIKLEHGYRSVCCHKLVNYSSKTQREFYIVRLYDGRENVAEERKIIKETKTN